MGSEILNQFFAVKGLSKLLTTHLPSALCCVATKVENSIKKVTLFQAKNSVFEGHT